MARGHTNSTSKMQPRFPSRRQHPPQHPNLYQQKVNGRLASNVPEEDPSVRSSMKSTGRPKRRRRPNVPLRVTRMIFVHTPICFGLGRACRRVICTLLNVLENTSIPATICTSKVE